MPTRSGWHEIGYLGALERDDTGCYSYNVPPTWLYTCSSTSAAWPTWTTTSSNTYTYALDWIGDGVVLRNAEPIYEMPAGNTVTRRVAVSTRAAEDASAAEARSAARVVALSRGEELLLSLLPPEQRDAYRLTGTFEVIGSLGTLYRVHRGVNGNVEWVKSDGSVGGKLCAHPTMEHGWLPVPDVAAAQLLALTTDEAAWLRKANVHRGTLPPVQL